METLEPRNFDVMWFHITSRKMTKFLCCMYRSPNDESYTALFEHLSNNIDWIQSTRPEAEVVILGDFNVHNTNWLKYSTRTDDAGREAEAFSVSCDFIQLVEVPTRIPDNVNHQPNILDLFLTSHPDLYTVTVSAPLGNSDHSLVSTTCNYPV